jgi:pimeloyl-ACP methyl ester carboxylesterase
VTVNELDVILDDGRTLHAYDTGEPGDGRLPVVWHHGTSNVGRPPEPLFPAAERLGIRWVSYDRPGYGGSTPRPGRDVASAAADVARVADALGIDRFGVVGHSGGGPHALACGALLPDRVVSVVSGAGLAPYDAKGLEWFAGMAGPAEASLRAAAEGREARQRYATSGDKGNGSLFTSADIGAFAGVWSWVLDVVRPAVAAGPAATIDDDLAYVAPWGFDPALVTAPVLVLHGGEDRMVPSSHGRWLADHCPTAQLRLYPDDGHISVLNAMESALEWLRSRAGAA